MLTEAVAGRGSTIVMNALSIFRKSRTLDLSLGASGSTEASDHESLHTRGVKGVLASSYLPRSSGLHFTEGRAIAHALEV